MSKIVTVENLKRFLSNLKSNYFDSINAKLNDKWGGIYIIEINSKELVSGDNYELSTQIYNDLKSFNETYPTIILIDYGLDVPRVEVVESVTITDYTATLIQIRPQVSTGSILLIGYSFKKNGVFEISRNTITKNDVKCNHIFLGNDISGTSINLSSEQANDLYNYASNYYEGKSFAITLRYNYKILQCSGVFKSDNTYTLYFINDHSSEKINVTVSKDGDNYTATMNITKI